VSTVTTYKDLIVWQKSMLLVEEVYALVKELPAEEKFGLASQIKRSAISIPSNIAEGWGRQSTGAYVNYLKISRGSLMELETQLILAERLKMVTGPSKVIELIMESSKMLNSMIKKMNNKVELV